MYIILLVIVVILIGWTAISYFLNRSVKTPEYTVVEKSEGYEIRSYKPYLTAQVEVSGTYDEAINKGFRILADYIFGNNTKQTSIAMTAPVVEKESEVLPMTAPVIETGDHTKRMISFVVPVEYTLEMLPKPTNSEVKIVPQKARNVAVLRFSWFRNTLRVAGKKQELFKLLERDSIKPKGFPEYAGYNAPFTAPWLNRNEVMIEIE
jgi:hypothetical protein